MDTLNLGQSFSQAPFLEVRGLKKFYPLQRGLLQRSTGYVKAVDGVDLDVMSGETVGIVGESGSGKTTLGRCITRLYDPTAGRVVMRDNGRDIVVTDLRGKGLRSFRRLAQTIFQDPYSSLNPRMTVLETIGEPLLVNNIAHGMELEQRVLEVMQQVGLRVEHMRRYPHSFSGGQRQRIGIARALILNPRLIVADEPVSALDVSIQAQILNLLLDLQQQFQLTYLFISHAMSVVRYVSDRIAVMYSGKLVEIGPKTSLLSQPLHPYTEMLLASIPKSTRRHSERRKVTTGEPPDLANLPSGCVFLPRCPYGGDACKDQSPQLRMIEAGRYVSCHHAEDLSLSGIESQSI